MRTAIVTVTVLLMAAAIFLTFWLRADSAADTRVPPGQYPVDAARFEWPVTERVAVYGPAKGMGSNKVGGRSADRY